MDGKTHIHHVALECISQQAAETFFTKVLGIPKVKSSVLPREITQSIFHVDKPVPMETYDNGVVRFEVFLSAEPRIGFFSHIGIEIEEQSAFIARCHAEGLSPFVIEKGGKQLLFVRDFSNNLFEVVEKIA